jgi:hypothetical protein
VPFSDARHKPEYPYRPPCSNQSSTIPDPSDQSYPNHQIVITSMNQGYRILERKTLECRVTQHHLLQAPHACFRAADSTHIQASHSSRSPCQHPQFHDMSIKDGCTYPKVARPPTWLCLFSFGSCDRFRVSNQSKSTFSILGTEPTFTPTRVMHCAQTDGRQKLRSIGSPLRCVLQWVCCVGDHLQTLVVGICDVM